MKLKPLQLHGHLRKPLMPLYWISGDEPLQHQECADLVRARCHESGFSDRETFNVDKGFDWQQFLQSINNLSLFSERKMFELRLSTRLDEKGRQAVQEFIRIGSPDYVLLISSPRLEAPSLKTKWFKSIEESGVLVQVWPVGIRELPAWLRQRLQSQGISAHQDALQLLVDRVEGNLLAAVQEIEKLKLLANAKLSGQPGEMVTLDARTVMQVVAESARYSIYDLIDAALEGDAGRAVRMLHGLRSEGAEPLQILGALCRELRSLLPMLNSVREGRNVAAVISSHHVWFNRKNAVGSALGRLKSIVVFELLEQARQIDLGVKGLAGTNPWDGLDLMIMHLSGAGRSAAR
ncbi:MAG: DNA polymerase III subunit delta [Pseudohongiellaceae bacterium]